MYSGDTEGSTHVHHLMEVRACKVKVMPVQGAQGQFYSYIMCWNKDKDKGAFSKANGNSWPNK